MEAERLVERISRYIDSGGHGSDDNLAMTAEDGLPASRVVIAFGHGRWDDVVAELAPIREPAPLRGSNAQRDVLQRTLLDAALHTKHHDLARSLVSERASPCDHQRLRRSPPDPPGPAHRLAQLTG